MNDMANHKLKWGKYKGTHLKDIPDDYLKFIIDKTDILKGKMLIYAKSRLNYPKNKYKVTVIDSVNSDGTYDVEAYNSNQAIWICQKKYKIQNTQSYHGTSYDVILNN
jgi:uncharacterized protein (DUF3820 family)